MLLENDVTTRLLLVMTEAGVVEMVAVDFVVAAPVVVLLTCSLLCIRAATTGPVTEAYVTHRHEDGTSFRTGEKSMPFVGAVACSLTCCCTLGMKAKIFSVERFQLGRFH